MIGAWVKRVDLYERLVKGNGGGLSAEKDVAAGELSAVVPGFLVIVVDGNEIVDRLNCSLFSCFGSAGVFGEAFFLHACQDQLLLAVAGVLLDGVGALCGLVAFRRSAHTLQSAAQAPPSDGAVGIELRCHFEGAG